MPEIKFKHIVSCSSEDPQFPAENLLRSESFKKWKCAATSGDKQAVVIIQLEKSSEIQSIDIGNEGSAFIEVSVGKSSEGANVNYQTLLTASSFMSPVESKNGSNVNRVRMFGPDNLLKDVLVDKWDLIKVACSQPFTRNSQPFGLSFIRLHEPGGDVVPNLEAKTSVGGFAVKGDEGDSTFHPGSLFKKRSQLHEEVKSPSVKQTVVRQPSSDKGDGVSADYLSKAALKVIPKDPEAKLPLPKRENSRDSAASKESQTPKPSTSTPKIGKLKSSSSSKESSSPAATEVGKTTAIKYVEFSKLMTGVTFALSGFVNPQRADLRDKACKMGATFKSDWDKSCTHLICAFSNTPKYNQVKGKGKIVKADWITDSFKNRRLMHWHWEKYSFEKVAIDPTNEVEIVAKADSPPVKESTKQKDSDQAKCSVDSKKRKKPTEELSEEDLYNISTDEENGKGETFGEDVDTDDEISRHQAKSAVSPAINKTPRSTKKARVELDEEGLPVLPDLFEGMTFYLYGSFSAVERKQIHRCVATLNGKMADYMTDSVTHVITNSSEWDSGFSDALEDNPDLKFVKSAWILRCGKTMKREAIEDFLLVPPHPNVSVDN